LSSVLGYFMNIELLTLSRTLDISSVRASLDKSFPLSIGGDWGGKWTIRVYTNKPTIQCLLVQLLWWFTLNFVDDENLDVVEELGSVWHCDGSCWSHVVELLLFGPLLLNCVATRYCCFLKKKILLLDRNKEKGSRL